MQAATRWWNEWWAAVTFLTIIPAPAHTQPPGGLGAAGRWFPLVGLLLGGLLWATQAAAAMAFDPWLTGLLVVTAWAALTGGLHLDGLADCGDALCAAVDRTRRLEILRDPRLGSFGAITLILALLLKAAAAGSAPGVALLLAPVWARGLLLVAARQPQARPGGLGASFAAGLTPHVLLTALATAAIPTVLIGLPWHSLAALTLAVLVTLGIVRLARARLGGVTGDVLGLVVEASETALLLVFVALAGLAA